MGFVHFLGFLDNNALRNCDQSAGTLEIMGLAYVAITPKEGEDLQTLHIKG